LQPVPMNVRCMARMQGIQHRPFAGRYERARIELVGPTRLTSNISLYPDNDGIFLLV
jgi:hypothetical protein